MEKDQKDYAPGQIVETLELLGERVRDDNYVLDYMRSNFNFESLQKIATRMNETRSNIGTVYHTLPPAVREELTDIQEKYDLAIQELRTMRNSKDSVRIAYEQVSRQVRHSQMLLAMRIGVAQYHALLVAKGIPLKFLSTFHKDGIPT